MNFYQNIYCKKIIADPSFYDYMDGCVWWSELLVSSLYYHSNKGDC